MKKLYRDVKVERYFPDVLAPAKEFKEIAAAEDPEYALMYDAAWKWFANTFIFHADEDGIARWEKMLSIYPEPTATLEDRRVALYLALNGTIPYTERSFKNFCDNLYYANAVTPVVDPNQYTMTLLADDGMSMRIASLIRYARLMTPANIGFNVLIKVDMPEKIYMYAVTSEFDQETLTREIELIADCDAPIYIGIGAVTTKYVDIRAAPYDAKLSGGMKTYAVAGEFDTEVLYGD